MYHRINELAELFSGYVHAYGIYKVTGEKKGDKLVGTAATIKANVTIELWEGHLSGKQGLGVIPINEESKVKFAAIDIDEYKLDLGALNRKVHMNQLPLVLCRTKSGGAHLFLFLNTFYSAVDVQRKMQEFASSLGYGDCEIFPKQTKIITERGDIGQWINMPYFLAGKTQRYSIDADGNPMTLDAFLDFAKTKTVTPEALMSFNATHQLLTGGPPCLQQLLKVGFPAGSRNNGLFNMAVYARKAYPETWQHIVEQYNMKFMVPPLSMPEVVGIIRSVSKKDFMYMCNQPPIKQYCNKDLCKSCTFGVGGAAAGLPKFGTLTKIATEPPIWFLEVEGGGRLELSTDDLQNPAKFQNRCMDVLNVMPPIVKRDVWVAMVQDLLSDVVILDVPIEGTVKGQLYLHLEEFCTSKVAAKSHEEILLGKPWTSGGKHYFRLRDFLEYLDRQRFRQMPMNHVVMHLQEMGATKSFFNIKGKGINCYCIKEIVNKQTESFDPVKVTQKTPY